MNTTTAAVDLAKNVYQVAVCTSPGSIERHRLTRTQFERFFSNRTVDRVIMEACGSAHHFARRLVSQGIDVVLLPAQYVRAYVRHNKTDSADAMALLEAANASDIRPHHTPPLPITLPAHQLVGLTTRPSVLHVSTLCATKQEPTNTS